MTALSHPKFRSLSALAVVVLTTLAALIPVQVHATAKQLTCSPSAGLAYGGVTTGQTETLLASITNNGLTSVTISSISASSSKFKVSGLKLPQVLAAGSSLEVAVEFTPSASGTLSGKLTFSSNASNSSLDLNVTGAGVTSQAVTATPSSVSFGNVSVGGSMTVPVVLTNSRSSSVTLSSLTMIGGSFALSGAKFPLTMAKGQSVTLKATFTPQAEGLTGGSSFLAGPPLTIPLTGTGTGSGKVELTTSPTKLNFGNVAAGTTATTAVGLTAVGGSVTISSISSSTSQFAVPGVQLPLTVPSGKEVLVNVTFTPKSDGKATATLTLASNAADAKLSEPLAGVGTAAEVTLSWVASTSQHVKGYNVYRSTSKKGGQTKINSTLDNATTYNDTTVAHGTYYYSTTAVNSSGQESAPSEQVEAVVP
ncbi:MAG TPA: choice-of-anchor D domain-containing protein [Candidatus Sulfotelmatobacter sp.]